MIQLAERRIKGLVTFSPPPSCCSSLLPLSLGATQVVVVVPQGSRRGSRMSPVRVAALCVGGDVSPRPRCYWLGVKGKVHLRGTEDTTLGEVTATSGPRRSSHSVLEDDPPIFEAQHFSWLRRRSVAHARNGAAVQYETGIQEVIDMS